MVIETIQNSDYERIINLLTSAFAPDDRLSRIVAFLNDEKNVVEYDEDGIPL